MAERDEREKEIFGDRNDRKRKAEFEFDFGQKRNNHDEDDHTESDKEEDFDLENPDPDLGSHHSSNNDDDDDDDDDPEDDSESEDEDEKPKIKTRTKKTQPSTPRKPTKREKIQNDPTLTADQKKVTLALLDLENAKRKKYDQAYSQKREINKAFNYLNRLIDHPINKKKCIDRFRGGAKENPRIGTAISLLRTLWSSRKDKYVRELTDGQLNRFHILTARRDEDGIAALALDHIYGKSEDEIVSRFNAREAEKLVNLIPDENDDTNSAPTANKKSKRAATTTSIPELPASKKQKIKDEILDTTSGSTNTVELVTTIKAKVEKNVKKHNTRFQKEFGKEIRDLVKGDKVESINTLANKVVTKTLENLADDVNEDIDEAVE